MSLDVKLRIYSKAMRKGLSFMNVYFIRKGSIVFTVSAMLFYGSGAFCQTGDFFFSFSGGYQAMDMKSLNESYLDTFALPLSLFNENIHSGYSFGHQVGCHVSPVVSIAGGYTRLWAGSSGNPEFIGSGGTSYFGNAFLNVRTDMIHAQFLFHVGGLGKFSDSQSKLLQRLDISAGMEFGWGWTSTRLDFFSPKDTAYSPYVITESYHWKGRGVSGSPLMNVKYDLVREPFRLALGFEAGARWYLTNSITDFYGDNWLVGSAEEDQAIRIDHNGLFIRPTMTFRF